VTNRKEKAHYYEAAVVGGSDLSLRKSEREECINRLVLSTYRAPTVGEYCRSGQAWSGRGRSLGGNIDSKLYGMRNAFSKEPKNNIALIKTLNKTILRRFVKISSI
jgi:hypothetical protein